MRAFLLLLPLMATATPTLAAEPVAAPKAKVELPAELSDPALADRLGRMTGVLAKAMMRLPVGELEAAIEDRQATAADKARTLGDMAAIDERKIAEQAAAGGKAMQAATKALVARLPAMMAALEGVEDELKKAVANLPDPTYPKR